MKRIARQFEGEVCLMRSVFSKQKLFNRILPVIAALFSAAVFLLSTAQTVRAAVLTVPGPQFPCDISPRPAPPAEDNCLQSAINAALPGDDILLEPGRTYPGSFLLRTKENASGRYIRIMTAAIYQGFFPPAGHRVNPSHAGLMPKLVAAAENGTVFRTELKVEGGVYRPAHHYALIGLEITQAGPSENTRLIKLGRYKEYDGRPEQESLDAVAHHLIIDRSYIHGLSGGKVRNGIELHSRDTAIINSYISEIHNANSESHCIAGWSGPGPYRIINNHIEGGDINILFGGASPTIPGMVPSDIEVRHNTIRKPAEWYGATPYRRVKNLFELKNARRVKVDRNLFENIWGDGQDGSAIVLTPKNDENDAPWTTVEDVVFSNNIVRRAWGGVRITRGNYAVEQPPKRISIINNVFSEIDPQLWCGSSCSDYTGKFIPTISESEDVVIDHNTILQSGNILSAGTYVNAGFVYQNNLGPHNEYGIKGDGTGVGNATLQTYFPGAEVRHNAIINTVGTTDWSPYYPSGNRFSENLSSAGFVDQTNPNPKLRNYRLAPSSPYRNQAGDGKDIGANIDALNSALRSSDFDSDGKTEIAVWRPADGSWYIYNSADKSVRTYRFGVPGDIPAAADYDGDGQTDYAVFRPESGVWYVLRSSNSHLNALRYGQAGDIPVPSDYDGDGKADFAVFRPSNGTWYVYGSVSGTSQFRFGLNGDKPVVSDYDGDGRADFAVWRPADGTWHFFKSHFGNYESFKFGIYGDVPIRGDFDGDQRIDFGVWRPRTQTWYIWESSSWALRANRFGLETDTPIIGDFDGDNKSDISVWRASEGSWYSINSGENLMAVQFGASGDIPVSNPFLP